MKKSRRMSYYRRPKIRGRAKLVVKVTKPDKGSYYVATGYIRRGRQGKQCIGEISAYRDRNSLYLTVGSAELYSKKWTGKGYGHILYWALAKRAVQEGMKGLRSRNGGRNEYSDGAWKKIKTHQRGYYSYLTLE